MSLFFIRIFQIDLNFLSTVYFFKIDNEAVVEIMVFFLISINF